DVDLVQKVASQPKLKQLIQERVARLSGKQTACSRQKRYLMQLDASGVPTRAKPAIFDPDVIDPSPLTDLVEATLDGHHQTILLLGGPGSSKTSLAAYAVGSTVYSDHGATLPRYVDAWSLMSAVDPYHGETLMPLVSPDILVIDDLGTEVGDAKDMFL